MYLLETLTNDRRTGVYKSFSLTPEKEVLNVQLNMLKPQRKMFFLYDFPINIFIVIALIIFPRWYLDYLNLFAEHDWRQVL